VYFLVLNVLMIPISPLLQFSSLALITQIVKVKPISYLPHIQKFHVWIFVLTAVLCPFPVSLQANSRIRAEVNLQKDLLHVLCSHNYALFILSFDAIYFELLRESLGNHERIDSTIHCIVKLFHSHPTISHSVTRTICNS